MKNWRDHPRPAPQPFHWTLAEYRELYTTNLFHDLKTMLIDGVFYVQRLPDPPHNAVLGLTHDWLWSVFKSDHHVCCQMGFDIENDTDPGPDLAVVHGAIRDYTHAKPTQPALIVEVADSSLHLDTTIKAEK